MVVLEGGIKLVLFDELIEKFLGNPCRPVVVVDENVACLASRYNFFAPPFRNLVGKGKGGCRMVCDLSCYIELIAGTGRDFVVYDGFHDDWVEFPFEEVVEIETFLNHKIVSRFFQIVEVDALLTWPKESNS